MTNVYQAYRLAKLSGDGYFTKKCQLWIEKNMGAKKAFLTHSCTSALEMAAILADIKHGDEVILPSFTFVSTANAFSLRGAKPIFVDIHADTLNINENLIEKAITKRTKAIVPVHYAGVGCNMDYILKIAKRHKLIVIEDAAHGMRATYRGKELGTMGDFGVLSFHETKNIVSGEGGALLVNDQKYIRRAEIIWQKGTDRSKYSRGEVSKYSWLDYGSSFLPSELTAAFLWGQLQEIKKITEKRKKIWYYYHISFRNLEEKKYIKRPTVPKNCKHNSHNYFLIVKSKIIRNKLLKFLGQKKIIAAFHYLPLHTSPFIKKYFGNVPDCVVSRHQSNKIIRLPLYTSMQKKDQTKVIYYVSKFFAK